MRQDFTSVGVATKIKSISIALFEVVRVGSVTILVRLKDDMTD